MATEPATPFTFTLCYAAGNSGTVLLLVRRQLIQKWVDGLSVRGIIPSWAGQWGIVADRPQKLQPIEQTAYAAFLAQTGINLGDTVTARRYGVIGTETKNLQDNAYNPVPVFYVIFTPDGLKSLSADIQANLEAQQIRNGVLQTVSIKPVTEAKSLLGPVSPPPDGWKAYLIQNYYGGKAPGQLNTDIDQLTAQLTERSAEPATSFRLAIENTPASIQPPPPVTRLVELKVSGAERSPGGTWYQSYSPDQAIRIQAVTDPQLGDTQNQIVWQGGAPDPSGYPALRIVPLKDITPSGTFLTVQATLANQSKSVRVAVVPNILGFDVNGAMADGNGKWSLDPNCGESAVVRAMIEPDSPAAYKWLKWNGGEVDSKHPDDRRLVPVKSVLDPKKPLPIEVEINLD
ncbi:MAG: hypothetical protein M0Q44_16285 [Methylobacter sp.]|jgi:hypothetical protein|nr:hypothetical protein [Methylobacter sp.]